MEIGKINSDMVSGSLNSNGVSKPAAAPKPVSSGQGGAVPQAPVPLQGSQKPDFQDSLVSNGVAKRQPTEKEVTEAVEKLNKMAKVFDRKVRFEVDNQRGEKLRVYIVGEDDKVVKALPPDEVLDVSERIQETIGLLFDKKA